MRAVRSSRDRGRIMLLRLIPILAAPEGIVGIIVFLIAFIGWIINIANQGNPQKKRAGHPARERGRKVQDEIDDFLQQSKRGREQRPARAEAVDDIELIDEPRARRRPPRKRVRVQSTSKKPGARQQERTPVAKQRKTSGEKLSDHHLRSSLAENARDAQAQEKVSRSVGQSVESHLGTFSAMAPTSMGQLAMATTTRNSKSAAAKRVLLLFRSKQRVRDAVIVNEIFSKPRSLR